MLPLGPVDTCADCPPAARAGASQDSPTAEADRLKDGERDPAGLRQAIASLDRALCVQSSNYELLWRLARARCLLAVTMGKEPRIAELERAQEVAARAVAADPNRAEGHYWLGAAYGRLAEVQGAFSGLSLAKKMRQQMEQVVRIAPGYEQGDAFLALGELYRNLPWILGGDRARAVAYLRQGLAVAPANSEIKLSLARTLIAQRQHAEAKNLLTEIVAGPGDATAAEAEKLLATLVGAPPS
jgi:cytochrome c-type biogenesis protein CcmH/NrfG